jgi:Lar family restriction alleviation protein
MTPTEQARESDALLSCPFCGATPELREWDWPYERHQVRCKKCGTTAGGRKALKADAIAAWNTRAALSGASEVVESEGWQPVETAPETKGKYLFCDLAFGPADDQTTANGFRWNGRWFAAGIFYKGGPNTGCQHEFRQIEISPTHWKPSPSVPALSIPPRLDGEREEGEGK